MPGLRHWKRYNMLSWSGMCLIVASTPPVAQDGQVTGARLFIAAQIGQLDRYGLTILGVEAVEEM